MSKPSEKAMQLAGKFEWSLHGVETLAACIEQYAAAELEAQHRKTWALALEAVKGLASTGGGFGSLPNDIGKLPCPPIEATKDK